MKRQRRVKYSVELGNGTARFRVGVTAQSVRRALIEHGRGESPMLTERL
jgi:hypothetical protein